MYGLLFEDHGDDAVREDRVQHVRHLLGFLLRHEDRRSQHHEPTRHSHADVTAASELRRRRHSRAVVGGPAMA